MEGKKTWRDGVARYSAVVWAVIVSALSTMAVIPEFVADSVSQLSTRESLFIVVVAAVVVHLIFKRWEPTSLPILSTLLVFIPGLLSALFIPEYGSLTGTLVAFSTFLLSLSTSIIAYRLSPFHPMARYPGPTLAKISKWYMVYIIQQGTPWLWLQAQHEKHGDVVRIGPNEVSIVDVNAILPVMGSQGMPKGPSWDGRGMHQPVKSMIAVRDPAEHQRRRRPWNRAFNTAATKEYEPMLKKRAVQLVEALEKQSGIVDLAQWISYFSYDFMGDMVFGGGTELMANGDSEGLLRTMKEGFDITQVYDHVPWISHYTKNIPTIGKKHKTFRSMAISRTAERYKHGSTTKDLFYYLSNEDGAEKESPSQAMVLSEGVLALVAGSATTAGTLSTAFFCMLKNRETYQRLQAEVDKYYPSGEDSLSTKHHQDMPYLEAVINETLRLFPALPGGSQRAPQTGKGDKICGPYYIPEGNNVRMTFYSFHHHPRYFSYPERFWPERWLIAEGLEHCPEKIAHEPRAFVPFSFGPSNCVGKYLAMQNMRTVLCHMMQKLEISLPEGQDAQSLDAQFTYRSASPRRPNTTTDILALGCRSPPSNTMSHPRRPTLPRIQTDFTQHAEVTIPASTFQFEGEQGRRRAEFLNKTPPSNIPETDFGAVTEVFLAADPDPRWGYNSMLGRPWIICWHVGIHGKKFRIIELADEEECWVYWGPRNVVMDLTDYDAIPLGRMSLEGRQMLEALSLRVPVAVRSTEMFNRDFWIEELLGLAVQKDLLKADKVSRGIAYISACPFTTQEFWQIVKDKYQYNARHRSAEDRRRIVHGSPAAEVGSWQ
ncbi:hypothetical protein NM688_g5462 [Phlebia brevispora]|uniref:Uncharacterized protein n=1 Tax=Phlebia brevispora TaxID=194682 RepID=A0ACC1SV51_9APHY|nr:hypothetical protein NM688_g5462 [Phlebia brevispora]